MVNNRIFDSDRINISPGPPLSDNDIMTEDLLTLINEVASTYQIDDLGFASVLPLIDLMRLDGAQTGMFNAISLLASFPKEAAHERDDEDYDELYCAFANANKRLSQAGAEIALTIRSGGYKAWAVPPAKRAVKELGLGALSHKAVARLAGLGWIGRSGLLVSPTYGPRARLTTVLTDAPLSPNGRVLSNGCGDCRICIDSCPNHALRYLDFGDHPTAREDIFDWKACEKGCQIKIPGTDFSVRTCSRCLTSCPIGER